MTSNELLSDQRKLPTTSYNDERPVKEDDKEHEGEDLNEQKTNVVRCHAMLHHNSALYLKSSTYIHQTHPC